MQNALAVDDHQYTITLLTQLLEISPWAKHFRETRAESYIAENDILAAISDLRSVNRLSQDSTDGYFKIADLLYQLGHASDALKEIRECLKLDPEHKLCFPFYKKVKKVEKALSDAQEYLDNKEYDECIEAADRALKQEKEVPMIIFSGKQLSCACHLRGGMYTAAITKCREALEMQKDPAVLCDRAEAYLESDMFDEGKCPRRSARSEPEKLIPLPFQLFTITRRRWRSTSTCNEQEKESKRRRRGRSRPSDGTTTRSSASRGRRTSSKS